MQLTWDLWISLRLLSSSLLKHSILDYMDSLDFWILKKKICNCWSSSYQGTITWSGLHIISEVSMSMALYSKKALTKCLTLDLKIPSRSLCSSLSSYDSLDCIRSLDLSNFQKNFRLLVIYHIYLCISWPPIFKVKNQIFHHFLSKKKNSDRNSQKVNPLILIMYWKHGELKKLQSKM